MIAVLVGGPFDGRGTPIADNQFDLLIPHRNGEPILVDFSSDRPPLNDWKPAYGVAVYVYQPIFTEIQTNIMFFLFSGERSDLIV